MFLSPIKAIPSHYLARLIAPTKKVQSLGLMRLTRRINVFPCFKDYADFSYPGALVKWTLPVHLLLIAIAIKSLLVHISQENSCFPSVFDLKAWISGLANVFHTLLQFITYCASFCYPLRKVQPPVLSVGDQCTGPLGVDGLLTESRSSWTGQETTRRTAKICMDALGHFSALAMLLQSWKWQNIYMWLIEAAKETVMYSLSLLLPQGVKV